MRQDFQPDQNRIKQSWFQDLPNFV